MNFSRFSHPDKKKCTPFTYIFLIYFLALILPSLCISGSPKEENYQGLKILNSNPFYFSYRNNPQLLVTNAYYCNNLPEWFGDRNPKTEDCILDRMYSCRLNHCIFIMEMRKGCYDSIVTSAFNYKLDICWNEDFFQLLKKTIEYAQSLDIITEIVLVSGCELEAGSDRWGKNLFNVLNKGPVPGDGLNFFQLQEPSPDFYSWTWEMWNTYYQMAYIEKIVSTCGSMPNVTYNICWEIDDLGLGGVEWAKSIATSIHELCNYRNLVSITPCQPVDEYLKISEIDYILLENRGIMEEFLKYGKPLVVGGPIASQMIDEVEFMYRSTSKGFHPSTNLVGECAYTKTAGYEYSSRLQTFVDGITAWNLEPGNMLSVTNLPAMKTNGNNPPELKWNGTPPYTLDGTNPDTLKAGQKMSFCFKYIDIDDTPPQRNEVWIDVNCNGVFSPDERLPMNRCQGTSYKKGVVFIKDNVSIPVNKTTQIKYCFYFTDSYYSPPAGEASGIHTFYVVKN